MPLSSRSIWLKYDLDGHTEHHTVERYIKGPVDLLPPPRARNGSVACESPNASRSGSRATGATDKAEYNQWNQETKSATRAPDGGFQNSWDRLSGGKGDQLGQIWNHEDKWYQEEKPGNGVDDNSAHHGLWNLSGRLLDLFAHTTIVSWVLCA